MDRELRKAGRLADRLKKAGIIGSVVADYGRDDLTPAQNALRAAQAGAIDIGTGAAAATGVKALLMKLGLTGIRGPVGGSLPARGARSRIVHANGPYRWPDISHPTPEMNRILDIVQAQETRINDLHFRLHSKDPMDPIQYESRAYDLVRELDRRDDLADEAPPQSRERDAGLMRRVEHAAFGLAIESPEAGGPPSCGRACSRRPRTTLGTSRSRRLRRHARELAGGPHDAASVSEQGLMDEARWLTDLYLLDEEDVELAGGLPARRTLATYRQGMSSVTLEQWHAIHDGRALALAATGPTEDYAAMHDLWREIVGSVRLGDDG